MTLRTDLTDATVSAGVHADQHNQVNAAVLAAQTALTAETARATAAEVANQPPGSIIFFGGAAAPGGWLLCNGASLLRATYPALFAAIGTYWGFADTTHFNVPDLRGRTPIGVGTGTGLTARALAAAGGTEIHTLTAGEMPSHNHPDSGHNHGNTGVQWQNHTHWPDSGFNWIGMKLAGSTEGLQLGSTGSRGTFTADHTSIEEQNHTHGTVTTTANPAPAGGGGAFPQMPPYLALTAIIKF